MATVDRVGDLEIPHDMAFQEREWTVQRAGWAAMLLIALVALTGLLGAVPLSQATAGENGPLRVTFPRFAHVQTPTELRVVIAPGAVTGNEVRVWLNRAFLDHNEIRMVVPEPDRVEVAADRLSYVFLVTDPAQETQLTFYVEPSSLGRHPGEISLDGGTPVAFSQFVYP
jgi:hypothetical protein